jgi:hypothetical protein
MQLAPAEREKLFDTQLMDSISKRLKSFGFLYVCMPGTGRIFDGKLEPTDEQIMQNKNKGYEELGFAKIDTIRKQCTG